MVVVTAGVFLLGLMISYSGIVAISFGMVELRKRKNKNDDDGDSVAPATSPQSGAVPDDDGEEELRSESKRKKEDVVTKTKKIHSEGAVSHACRFCAEVFTQSQALGGHMNKHRSEKQLEEVQKAQELIARSQPYIVSNSWNIPSSLQNSQMNQQNLLIATQPSQGDSYNYNSAQQHVSSTWTTSPIGQFQAQRGLGVNSGQQQYPAIQTVYSNSNPVLHGGRHTMQPQYGSQLHGNQGGLQDSNIASSSQQGQTNLPIAPLQYPSSGEQMVQFIHQYGNLGPNSGGGDNFQMLQGYNQRPLDQRPNMGGLINSGSSGIGSEHNQPGQGIYGMPSLDAGQEFQGGTDHREDTALMESGQAGFQSDGSIDDHTSARML